MGKPAPKGVPIAYLYCRHSGCALHDTYLRGDKTAKVAGDPCPYAPTDPKHRLEKINLESSMPLPEREGSTKRVHDGLPYGGFVLEVGDRDDTSRWGGAVVSDPRFQGAHYVAELQLDLLLLGFFANTRNQSLNPIGVFDIPLMAAVLDFKSHIVDQFNANAVDKLSLVPSAPSNDDAPILWKPLLNPFRAFRIEDDLAFLTNAGALPARLKDYCAAWGKTKGVGPAAEVAARGIKKLGETVRAIGSQAHEAAARVTELTRLADVTDEAAGIWPKKYPITGAAGPSSAGVETAVRGAIGPAHASPVGGGFGEMNAAHAGRSKEWGAAGILLPDGWAELITSLDSSVGALSELRAACAADKAKGLGEGYRQALRNFGVVDRGTARAIRQMASGETFRQRGVFRVPLSTEMELLKGPVDDELVKQLLSDVGQVPAERPIPLIRAFLHKESGEQSFSRFGGNLAMLLGIDHANAPEDVTNFSELTTDPTRISSSRGWGPSQVTSFSKPLGAALEVPAAPPFRYVKGIPVVEEKELRPPKPKFIQSIPENLRVGLKMFQQKYDSTRKRDCTFRPTKYNCVECKSTFDVRDDVRGGDLRKDGSSYRVMNADAVLKLLKAGTYELTPPLSEDEKKALAGEVPSFEKMRESTRAAEQATADQEGAAKSLTTAKKGLKRVEGQLAIKALDPAKRAALEAERDALKTSVEQSTKAIDDATAKVEKAKGDAAKATAECGKLRELLKEFPCSWLTAVFRYNGAGSHAWNYMLDVLATHLVKT